MRLWITRLFRMKVVLADAALYILCALTSSGALAYTDNNGVAHCLSEAGSPARAHAVQAASSHFRSDGTWHEHHSNGTQHKHDGKVVADNCCRVLCISAIIPVVTLRTLELGAPLVPYKSLVELRAIYMPDAARAVSGIPRADPEETGSPRF